MKKLLCVLLVLVFSCVCFAAEDPVTPIVYAKVTSTDGSNVPIYVLPGEYRDIVTYLSNGTQLFVLFEGSVWHKVKTVSGGQTGWIKSSEITVTTRGLSALNYGCSVTAAKLIKSTDGYAALRWGPGLEYDVMDNLPSGRYCWQFERCGDWCRVLLEDGRIGYVHYSLLTNTSKKTTWNYSLYGYVQVSGGSAVYRKSPNYSSAKLGIFANGEVIEILGESGGFYYFYSEKKNLYAYISTDIVSPEGLNTVAYWTELYYDNPYNYLTDILWDLNAGQVLKVLATDGYISRVQYDDVIGYVDNNALTIHH